MVTRNPFPRRFDMGSFGLGGPAPRDLLILIAVLFVTFSLRFFAATAIVLLLPPAPSRADDRPDWENEQVVGIGKLDPHAPVYPFADAATARTLARAQSPYYRLLNGQW